MLHPTLDKDDLCKALVAQYLSHDGYVETARAFAGEVRAEAIALRGRPEPKLENFLSVDEDHDATNRQRMFPSLLQAQVHTANPLRRNSGSHPRGRHRQRAEIDTCLLSASIFRPFTCIF